MVTPGPIPHDGEVSLWESPDVAGMRTSYESGQLRRADLAPTPLAQFQRWLADAVAAGLPEPNAMVLATAAPHRDEDGPWQGPQLEVTSRIVLLKAAEGRGLSFFTNYTSRKAAALLAQPEVSLLFPWFAMERQVSLSGVAERLPAEESAAYFRSRPHGSQVAAWASRQSTPLTEGRDALDARFAALGETWPEGSDVPVPEFWGGFLVRPRAMEFWHGRQSRMHDRLRYVSASGAPADLSDAEQWRVVRYSP